MEKLKEAITLDNNFSFAYLQLSTVYKKLGNEKESKKSYEKALLMNPHIKVDTVGN